MRCRNCNLEEDQLHEGDRLRECEGECGGMICDLCVNDFDGLCADCADAGVARNLGVLDAEEPAVGSSMVPGLGEVVESVLEELGDPIENHYPVRVVRAMQRLRSALEGTA